MLLQESVPIVTVRLNLNQDVLYAEAAVFHDAADVERNSLMYNRN